MTPEDVKALMPQVVPFVGTLKLVYEEVEPTRAVLRLLDEPAFHNHVGGPHAGAIFSLAESATGAVVMASFGDLLDRVTPLAATAQISYRKLQKGPVTATATLGRPREEVLAGVEAGELVQFPVDVVMTDEAGTVTSEMTVSWALKPHRRPDA